MTDAELLESWRATRDRAVLDSLFARHYPTVYHVVLQLVRNSTDANDVTQSTFLKALESADRFRSTGSLRNWLLAIAVNEVRQFRRSAARRGRPEHLPEFSCMGGQEGEAQRREFEAHLEQVLQQFPDELKDPLVLHYYQNLSYSEMAEVLAIPKSTVQFRMDQALRDLREEFKKRNALSLLVEFFPTKRPIPLFVGAMMMKTKTLAVALVVLCCLFPFGAFVWKAGRPVRSESAATGPSAPKTPEAAASGSTEPLPDGAAIFGRVVEKSSEAPIPGALVAVYNVEEGTTDQVLTDEKGRFRLAQASRAVHQLKITAKGYASLSAPGLEASREPRTYPLSAGGTITGSVVDLDGLPQFPYRLHLMRDLFEEKPFETLDSLYLLALPQKWILEEGETTVRPDGRFEIRNVRPGRFILVVTMDGAHPFIGPALKSIPGYDWPVVVQEGKVVDVRIVRPAKGTLRIRVVDAETRAPLAGARVKLMTDIGRFEFDVAHHPAVTDETGMCTLPAGLFSQGGTLASMNVHISRTGYSSRSGSFGGQDDGYLLEVALGKPARLHGRVRKPDETPVERAAVVVERPVDGAVLARAFTDAKGAYAIEGIDAPGKYAVHVVDPGLRNFRGVAPVVLREGESRELNFGASGQAAIAGTVSWKGAQVRTARVCIDPEQGKGERLIIDTNERGEYRLEGVQPGIYDLSVGLPDKDFRPTRQVTVRAGETTRADFALGSGRIRGVARDAGTFQPLSHTDYFEVVARRVGGDEKETVEAFVREGGAFELNVDQRGIYILSLSDNYGFSAAPVQVDLTAQDSADDVGILYQRNAKDGSFRLRLVDAATGEPVLAAQYRFWTGGSVRGAGHIDNGLIQEKDAEIGRYRYLVGSTEHVVVPVDFDLRTRKEADLKVALQRSEAVRVGGLLPSSAAEKAGLEEGDIVVSYDGAAIRNIGELRARLTQVVATQKVPVEIRRGGEQRVLMVPGGELGMEIENTLLR